MHHEYLFRVTSCFKSFRGVTCYSQYMCLSFTYVDITIGYADGDKRLEINKLDF